MISTVTEGAVTSADGTRIAFDKRGSGPALILVDGALCYRASGPNGPLADALARDFTVYTYDRRGRGASGDTSPFSVDREVEDLAAVIEATEEPTCVFGISSGAALALEAAQWGLPIKRLALYEPPYVVDASRPPVPDDFAYQLSSLVTQGKPGDAVKLFMTTGVQVPRPFVALMRLMPAWRRMTAVARTLPYDIAAMHGCQAGNPLPSGNWAEVQCPVLVAWGSKSPDWTKNAMTALIDVLPRAASRVLDGQTHMVKPAALAPELVQFLSSKSNA
jgi:pimeloyl-ACP methyl ester carboxylesterase